MEFSLTNTMHTYKHIKVVALLGASINYVDRILLIYLASLLHKLIVQFPNSVPVIVNLDLTLNFATLIGGPQ